MTQPFNDPDQSPDIIPTRGNEPPMDAIQDYISSNGSVIGRVMSGVFSIRTLSEAEKLSTLLACHCPDPERTAPSIWELLSNAIEHGNLNISFDEKTSLLRAGTFHLEIERRLDADVYRQKRVRVSFERLQTSIRIVVTDEGKGFDFKKAMKKKFSLDLPNGRGITIAAKLSFDKLQYIGIGNEVEATIRIAS